MERKHYKIVSLIYGTVGLLVVMMNIATIFFKTDLEGDHALEWWSYLILVLAIFFIWSFFNKRSEYRISTGTREIVINVEVINKFLQFFAMYLLALTEIIDDYQGQYGMLMLFLSMLMALKYRIFNRRGLIICMIIFASLLEYGAVLSGHPQQGVYGLIFGIFFFSIATLLYTDELAKHFRRAKEYHDRLIKIEEKLKVYEKETIDPNSIGLTKREMDVLQYLCKTHGSNQDIADHLGIKVQTVKSHIKNIFDKAGVEDRHQLIDLFKHAFIQDTSVDIDENQ